MNNLVVISGASGMSGNETTRQLLKKGYHIIGFDNFFASSIESIKDLFKNSRFTFFEFDICNRNNMVELENYISNLSMKRKFNTISFINFAAVVHTKHFYFPRDTFETNVIGMKAFLDMAIRQKAGKFINCSSSEVYSLCSYKKNGVLESDLLSFATVETSMRTSYAAGKLMTEYFLNEAVETGIIKGCSIRFANVYSNDELIPNHIIPYAIHELIESNEITLLENAKNTYRTFLHNFDSCSSVISLLETENSLDGSVYNVGTLEEISIVELIQLIGIQLGHQDVKIAFKGSRSGDPQRRLLNVDKIKKRTGWVPKIHLLEGIKMCIEYKLAHK